MDPNGESRNIPNKDNKDGIAPMTICIYHYCTKQLGLITAHMSHKNLLHFFYPVPPAIKFKPETSGEPQTSEIIRNQCTPIAI